MNCTRLLTRIPSDDPCIQYWGNWEKQNGMKTFSQFSACMFCFYGTSVKVMAKVGPDFEKAEIELDGIRQKDLDLYRSQPGSAIVFSRENLSADASHSLRITARKGKHFSAGTPLLEIDAFEAETPVDYPAELKKQMEEEYRVIQSGEKEWQLPENWHPVAYRAVTPQKGVSLLDGVIRDLFLRNIALIKYDYSIPFYCEGPGPYYTKSEGPGWSHWLPASNEGRMLAGSGNALCWEEDPELREITDKIVSDIEARMREDGYYNYYPEEDSYALNHEIIENPAENGNYNSIYSERKNFDRVFWTRGLIAAHNAGNPKALPLLRRMYNWFNAQEGYLSHMLLGGNSTNGLPGGPLVYHTPAGVPQDLITSERFFDQDYWFRAFCEHQPMVFSHYPGERPHCYDLLQLEALADEYRATGSEKYRSALLGAWDIYHDNYKHIGGATAICESGGIYPPKSYYITTGHNGETCGSVFWIWVNHRMMQLFPEKETYAAQIEEALFNIILACKTEKGYTRYHNRMQGKKEKGNNENTCCESSSVGLVSSIPQYLYMHAEKELYINLFIPSVYRDSEIELRQETDFPYSGSVKFTVTPDTAKAYTLKIRIPQWASAPVSVFVNGTETCKGMPGSYTSVCRVWHRGDTVTLSLPLCLRAELYTGLDQLPENQNRYALLYGPLLMAVCGDFSEDSVPHLPFEPALLPQKLHPTEEPLTFAIEGLPDLICKPYYAVKDEETFTCFPAVGN